ncbi:MAG: FAD-dependent oxidoreductase [Thermodesulfobacteriota bacterium]
MYRYLFSPIRINNCEIKNRIAYPALGLLYSHDRKLNDKYLNYYTERARGGVGLLTVGPVGVDFLGSGYLALALDNDDAIPAFQSLTRAIKNEGASPWIQLFHAGGYSHPILIDGRQPMAPSAVFSSYAKTTPREMTREDIAAVQQAFAKAAVRAREAGFAGVEIIASAGYLLTQFLSPVKNIRTDEYGGSFENRVRFPEELIRLVRKHLGPDYPLTVRMAGNDFVTGSNTDAETPKIARIYEAAGVDAINVTGGWHEARVPQLPMDLPRSAFAFLALNIKKAVSIPVMASNRIATPAEAEKILRNGYADMVNLGRVLIADPEWPKKAFAGRADEIRPCTACSQGCTDQVFQGKPVFCVGNPLAGCESERRIRRSDRPKNVMIIGAGAAGLEAAVTAALAGHRVRLYDKGPDIGGQLWAAGAPPHKQELWEYIRYYRAMLRKYPIDLHLNTEVTPELIRATNPDHIIVAEGARPLLPPIKGVRDPGVLTSWEVLQDNPRLGKNVAVIGGGAVGLETALFVAAKGTMSPEILHFLFSYDAVPPERLRELMVQGSSRVTVFEMLPKAGKDVGRSTKWVLFDNLKKFGVAIITNARVAAVEGGRVQYEKDNAAHEQRFDNVIVASGSQPVRTVTEQLQQAGIPHTAIGDCLRPGKIGDAIHGGFLAAMNL